MDGHGTSQQKKEYKKLYQEYYSLNDQEKGIEDIFASKKSKSKLSYDGMADRLYDLLDKVKDNPPPKTKGVK
jgi:hypothetical protein